MLLHIITPVSFIYSDDKQGIALHFLVFGMSVFFPIISVLAMRAAGLMKSIYMEDKQDRIGPMIACITFYVWLFLNYKQFGVGPAIFIATSLGATISLALSFFINNFSKISLHSVGAGGLIGAMVIYRVAVPTSVYLLHIGDHTLSISPNIVLALILVIGGMIGTSRLILGAHRVEDVYGGYIVGILSQVAAYRLWDIWL